MSLASKSSLHAIVKIFSNVLKPHSSRPTPLGRWKLCENKNINLVVDYSNEDHCGTCGDYIISKRNNVKNIHTSNSDITMISNTDTLYIMEYSSMMINTPH